MSTEFFKQLGMTLKHYAPDILLIGGSACFGATCVFVGQGAIKAKAIMEDAKKDMELINKAHEISTDNSGTVAELSDKYNIPEEKVTALKALTEEDFKKDAVICKVNTFTNVARAFGPALIFGTAALGCFAGCKNSLDIRCAGLSASIATLDKSYDFLKKKFVKEVGAERVEKLLGGFDETETVNVTTSDENGNITTETVEVRPDPTDPYSFFFTETKISGSKNYEWLYRDCIANLNNAKRIQSELNDTLRARTHGPFGTRKKGYMYLNEVRHIFGEDETPEGWIAGWVLDPKIAPVCDTELYIDLGLDHINPNDVESARCILIRPNCKADIWSQLKPADYFN